MKEEWKNVFGYEDLYEISNLARIRRGVVRSNIRKCGEEIKQRIDKYGYYVVDLWKDGKSKRPRVHVLLMRAWVGERTAPDIRHLDGNKSNNSLDNLKYGTRSENLKDDYKHKNRISSFKNKDTVKKAINSRRPPRGESNGKSKLNNRQVDEIRKGNKFKGYAVYFSKKFKVSKMTVHRVANYKSWKI